MNEESKSKMSKNNITGVSGAMNNKRDSLMKRGQTQA
jgi:hypothetical protein